MMTARFACSPPYFNSAVADEEGNWIGGLCAVQFPMISHVPLFGLLICMCLASLLYHRQWIQNNFLINHIVQQCSNALRREDVVTRLTGNNAFVVVMYPWNDHDGHTYTGVPPYVSMMQELELLQNNQMNLIDNFVARVKQALEEYGMNSKQITVDALQWLLDEFRDQISMQLQNFNVGGGGNALVGPAD